MGAGVLGLREGGFYFQDVLEFRVNRFRGFLVSPLGFFFGERLFFASGGVFFYAMDVIFGFLLFGNVRKF